jgi:hypothetical protein
MFDKGYEWMARELRRDAEFWDCTCFDKPGEFENSVMLSSHIKNNEFFRGAFECLRNWKQSEW